jgi:YD repeat-containing protein
LLVAYGVRRDGRRALLSFMRSQGESQGAWEGLLGLTSSPNQATSYEQDVLDNVVHVNQGAQDRYFKYDSLSRIIREKQVEQNVNTNYSLNDAWNTSGAWTRQISYNSFGLVNETDDARGIRTQFTYDGLNRVTQIQYKNWDNSDQGTPAAHYYYDNGNNLPTGHPTFTPTNATGRLVAMTYGSAATGDYFNYDALAICTLSCQVDEPLDAPARLRGKPGSRPDLGQRPATFLLRKISKPLSPSSAVEAKIFPAQLRKEIVGDLSFMIM